MDVLVALLLLSLFYVNFDIFDVFVSILLKDVEILLLNKLVVVGGGAAVLTMSATSNDLEVLLLNEVLLFIFVILLLFSILLPININEAALFKVPFILPLVKHNPVLVLVYPGKQTQAVFKLFKL